jgi:hypothetical protein
MGLTTISFFGFIMQPEQDWLPISIPQTYLTLSSDCSEDSWVVFIFSLLCLDDPSLELDLRCCPVTALNQREARPTKANVTSYWIGNLLQMEFLGNPLGVATSLIDPLCSGGRGAVC